MPRRGKFIFIFTKIYIRLSKKQWSLTLQFGFENNYFEEVFRQKYGGLFSSSSKGVLLMNRKLRVLIISSKDILDILLRKFEWFFVSIKIKLNICTTLN